MRAKPAAPKISNAVYWNVLASPKNTTHNTPFVVADMGSNIPGRNNCESGQWYGKREASAGLPPFGCTGPFGARLWDLCGDYLTITLTALLAVRTM